MILKRRREHVLVSLCIVLIAVASCRSEDSPSTTNSAATGTAVSSTPPYVVREPERYHATRIITSVTADGRTLVTTSSTTRDGEMRRFAFELMSKKMILLDGPTGRFVMFPEEKIYADTSGQSLAGVVDEYGADGTSAEKLLHAEASNTTYQGLGKETIAGRTANKYRVVVNSSDAANVTPSETLLWIDEALGMVIRSETKSSDGSHSRMELSEISLEVDSSVFQLPADYQKLTQFELLARLGISK